MIYTFKLQAVLDHRQFLEDNLKKELAELRQAQTDAEDRLKMLNEKEHRTRETLSREQARGLFSNQVVTYHAYLKRLDDQIDSQKAEISVISERVIKKQDEVLDAMKNRQILEKLKEKDHERFNLNLQHKETAFTDEIAVSRFARQAVNHRGKDE